MIWRIGFVGSFIVGAAVLAYQIGSRLSDEAVMTLVGVLCGIVASIPVSIGLIIALTRPRPVLDPEEDDAYAPKYGREPQPPPYPIYRPAAPQAVSPFQQLPQPHPYTGQPPQIIVVSPSQMPNGGSQYGNYLLPPQAGPVYGAPMQERNFKIVGDDDGE